VVCKADEISATGIENRLSALGRHRFGAAALGVCTVVVCEVCEADEDEAPLVSMGEITSELKVVVRLMKELEAFIGEMLGKLLLELRFELRAVLLSILLSILMLVLLLSSAIDTSERERFRETSEPLLPMGRWVR
jgi:hypothetical protein